MRENVLKNGNFLLTFLGAAVSNVAAILYNFAVSFWILSLMDNNAVIQGAYLAVCGLTFVLFSPLGGVISDRFHKGKIMFVCDYLRGAAIIVSAILILCSESNAFSTAVLFAAGITGNFIAAVFSPAATALLPHILKEEQLIQANSYMSMLSSLQSIIGVILAAILYAAMPPTTLLILIGSCYVISGFTEMFIKYEDDHSRTAHSSAFSDLKEGFRYVFGNRKLLALVSVIIFINFFFSPVVSNFFPYFLKTDVAGHDYLLSSLITPESWNSVFNVFFGVASILCAMKLSAKKERGQTGKTVALWLVILAGLIAVLTVGYIVLVGSGAGLNAFMVMLCIGAALMGIAVTSVNVPTNTTVQIMTDKDKLGKVSAFLNMGAQGLIPLATFLAGIIVEYLGCSVLLSVCSLGFISVSVFALCSKDFRSI